VKVCGNTKMGYMESHGITGEQFSIPGFVVDLNILNTILNKLKKYRQTMANLSGIANYI